MTSTIYDRRKTGQTLVEAILLLPFVLLFVFGLLQCCQLAIGMIVVNYGASSAARKAVRTNDWQAAVTGATSNYKSLLVGGLKDAGLSPCLASKDDDGRTTNNVVVVAKASVDAFPVVGPMIDAMVPTFKEGIVNESAPCRGDRIPPISFSGSPKYVFTLYGVAVARRNYLQ